MTFEKQYKKNTKEEATICISGIGTIYTNDYVKWLERLATYNQSRYEAGEKFIKSVIGVLPDIAFKHSDVFNDLQKIIQEGPSK
jgi:hypothetical protein